MNSLCKLLIWSLLGCLLSACVEAQETVQNEGIFCDTEVQVEQFAAYYDSDSLEEALQQINLTAPRACGSFRAAFVPGRKVKSIRIKRGTLRIYEVLVVGVWTGQWGEVNPIIQYTVVLDEEESA